MRDQFPTVKDVAKADHVTLARWSRFLPSPRDSEEVAAINLMAERFAELGGMTSEVSKKIGWSEKGG